MVGFWTIDAGQIAIIATLFGIFLAIVRKFDRYGIEHEMLMDWYCRNQNPPLSKEDLPTRQRGGLTSIFRGSL